jgi:hypothetical protein
MIYPFLPNPDKPEPKTIHQSRKHKKSKKRK